MLQSFILDNVTPNKTLIVANGVHNHQEFVSLVKERLGELLPVPENQYVRKSSEYIGGELRNWTETPNTQISVAFEGASWGSTHQPALLVASALLGSTASVNRHKSPRKILAQHSFIDEAHAINHHFSDSGLFGFQVTGSGSHSKDLMEVLLNELGSLKGNISDEDLVRAKNTLKFNISRDLQCPTTRLEELAKNYTLFGENMNFHKYSEIIDSVTAHQINEVSFCSSFRQFLIFTDLDQQSQFKEDQSTLSHLSLMFRDSSHNVKDFSN